MEHILSVLIGCKCAGFLKLARLSSYKYVNEKALELSLFWTLSYCILYYFLTAYLLSFSCDSLYSVMCTCLRMSHGIAIYIPGGVFVVWSRLDALLFF